MSAHLVDTAGVRSDDQSARFVADLRERAAASCYRAGNFPAAEAHYRSALWRWQRLDDQCGMASVCERLGMLYLEWGQDGKALGALVDAYKCWQRLGSDRDTDRVRDKFRAALWTIGRGREAEHYVRDCMGHDDDAERTSR
jgi:tetratricopeptide (TPR) repeat protein